MLSRNFPSHQLRKPLAHRRVGPPASPHLHLIEHDLTDLVASISLVQRVHPDEIDNLAAQSFVGVSFEQPNTTAQVTGVGALNLLEAIRLVDPKIRFYQASMSEMFGKEQAIPQVEECCSTYFTLMAWPSSMK